MKFSVCVPNYNYAAYLKLTLESVLSQTGAAFEICVADNNSTDGSQALIERFAAQYPQLKHAFHPTNIGFSDNLLAVSQMAVGDWHILLSSDDLMSAGTLAFYKKFVETVGSEKSFAFGSSCDKIDIDGNKIGYLGPRSKIWRPSDLDTGLSAAMGCPVFRAPSEEVLQRSLSSFYGPFHFASTCYAANSYKQAGGYIGGRMYNPDKWFHWRLLTVVDEVFFIDKPTFAYRWHPQNQAALQKQSHALKYLVDEYRNTIEATPEMLASSKIERADIERCFLEEVVVKQAFAALKNAQRREARRALDFGKAVFPEHADNSKLFWMLGAILSTGAAGTWAAKMLKPQFYTSRRLVLCMLAFVIN